MKKKLILVAILFANLGFSQFTPTGTVTTDAKFRIGSIGLGYSIAPTWGNYKFMVNGDAFFSTKLVIGNPTFGSSNNGIETNKSIFMQGTSTLSPLIELYSGPGVPFGLGQFAVAVGNGNYSNNALAGDVVLRGQTPGSLIICNESAGKIKFATREVVTMGGTSKVQMTIDKLGNVGIGAESTGEKFEVTGNGKFNGKVGIGGSGTTPFGAFPSMAGGVSVSSYNLFVKGGILTEEVRVSLGNWADYVFADNYNLKPLKEVETFIKENGHLPNVPSSKEVKANGINVAEMAKIQQEKIEELTLYIIEQNKKLEEQNKRLEALEAKINKL